MARARVRESRVEIVGLGISFLCSPGGPVGLYIGLSLLALVLMDSLGRYFSGWSPGLGDDRFGG